MIHTLGPSDEMMERFQSSLLRVNPDEPKISDVEELEANMCSMAVSIDFGGKKVLLGGDMEVARKDRYNKSACSDAECSEHDSCGWCYVKQYSTLYPGDCPFSLVNLPHHSSVTGFCPQMWPGDFAKDQVIATSTVFNCKNGESLPTKEMLKVYYALCNDYYVTSDGQKSTKPVKNENVVEINENEEIQYEAIPVEGIGIVVSRWNQENAKWSIHKFGTACKVDDDYIAKYHKEVTDK